MNEIEIPSEVAVLVPIVVSFLTGLFAHIDASKALKRAVVFVLTLVAAGAVVVAELYPAEWDYLVGLVIVWGGAAMLFYDLVSAAFEASTGRSLAEYLFPNVGVGRPEPVPAPASASVALPVQPPVSIVRAAPPRQTEFEVMVAALEADRPITDAEAFSLLLRELDGDS